MTAGVLIAAILRGLGVSVAPPITRIVIREEYLARPLVTGETLILTHAVTDTQVRPS